MPTVWIVGDRGARQLASPLDANVAGVGGSKPKRHASDAVGARLPPAMRSKLAESRPAYGGVIDASAGGRDAA